MRKIIIKTPFEFIIHYDHEGIIVQKYTMINYLLEDEETQISEKEYHQYLKFNDEFFENEHLSSICKLLKPNDWIKKEMYEKTMERSNIRINQRNEKDEKDEIIYIPWKMSKIIEDSGRKQSISPFEFTIYYNSLFCIKKCMMRNFYLEHEETEISEEKYNHYLNLDDEFFYKERIISMKKLLNEGY